MRLAIFDMDGTVLRGNSWQEYFWWAVGEWPGAAPGLLARLALRKGGVLSARALRDAALRPLHGKSQAEVEEVGRRVFEARLRAQIRRAARREIAEMQAQGFSPVLATGAFEFLARPVAEELGVGEVVCTRLEYDSGVCGGRIRGLETRGEEKAGAVRERFANRAVEWAGSRAYTDDLEDLPLLNLVSDRVLVSAAGRSRTFQLPESVRAVIWPDD